MSLKIKKEFNNNVLTVYLIGRLDTITAPEFEEELNDLKIDSLIIDMNELEYISSAGLRIILKLHKKLVKSGGLKLINLKEEVREVFNITGFSQFLNIV